MIIVAFACLLFMASFALTVLVRLLPATHLLRVPLMDALNPNERIANHEGSAIMNPPQAIYCPDQNLADALDDLDYWQQAGLLLNTVAWIDRSPVVTAAAFGDFVAAHRRNDPNGNWGDVFEVTLSDAGRYMVHISGDALAAGHGVRDGMARADLRTSEGEVSCWPVGDGGVYLLKECEGWDEWAPI